MKGKRGTSIAPVLILCEFQLGLQSMVEKHIFSYRSTNVYLFHDHLIKDVSINSNENRRHEIIAYDERTSHSSNTKSLK